MTLARFQSGVCGLAAYLWRSAIVSVRLQFVMEVMSGKEVLQRKMHSLPELL